MTDLLCLTSTAALPPPTLKPLNFPPRGSAVRTFLLLPRFLVSLLSGEFEVCECRAFVYSAHCCAPVTVTLCMGALGTDLLNKCVCVCIYVQIHT